MPPTLAKAWESHWDRAAQNDAYPFNYAPYPDTKKAMEEVIPVFEQDKESFTRVFAAAAEPHEKAARDAEAKGDTEAARDSYLKAYGLYRMARFPCMNTPGKRAAYAKSQECVLKAWSFDDNPPRRVEMPFKGKSGEGDKVVAYIRVPKGVDNAPVLINWGGVDTFKEECLTRGLPFFDQGIALMMIDMPGTGDSPVLGSVDAERQWDPMFDWIEQEAGLDATRVAGWGGSFGGYWANKVAHTHADRFRAVISQGGGAHNVFQAEQVDRSQANGIPWGQSETRGNSFGLKTHEEWRDFAPTLSLLDQGVLDKPCCALLCINGAKDPITPIADYYLMLEHGSPKTARFFANGGHMGRPLDGSPDITMDIMVNWLKAQFGMA